MFVLTGGVFYDLGSGTGKVVLTAAILHNFTKCNGVELLSGLHEVAVGYKNAWDKNTSTMESDRASDVPSIEYICGSIFDTDIANWPHEADVVFSNTHCFDRGIMDGLSALAGD